MTTRIADLNLDKIGDKKLCYLIKNGHRVKESMRELIARHNGIYERKLSFFRKNYLAQRFEGDKYFFFYELAKTYDPKWGKFSTYVGNKTYWEMNRLINKAENRKTIQHTNPYSDSRERLDESKWGKGEGIEQPPFQYRDIITIIRKCRSEDKRKKMALSLHLEGKTLCEIGSQIKMSHEWVRKHIYIQLSKIKKELIKEGLVSL